MEGQFPSERRFGILIVQGRAREDPDLLKGSVWRNDVLRINKLLFQVLRAHPEAQLHS